MSLFGFRCVFILLAAAERDGGSLQGSHLTEIKTDDTGARYITEKLTEQTKNYQGGAKQSEQSYLDVRMYETSTALDPVAAFEFYLGKTHPDCKALFQTPNKATTKNLNFASTRHWYRNEPMGKNTISKMMETENFHQSRAAERYTNHCIRASTVTSLFQRGVSSKVRSYGTQTGS